MSQELEADVQAALDSGKKVTAIKLLRNHRGLGLKEAKDIVDAHDGQGSNIKSATVQGGPSKSIINSILLAVVGFVVYKIFLES